MSDLDDRQAIFAGVLMLANRLQTAYDNELEGITLKQWLALVVVSNMPQPVGSTAEIARILGTSHQNVTKLMAALVAKGFVALAPSPADRRARQVGVTTAGAAYLASRADQGEQILDDLFADVAAHDLAACLRVLRAMAHALTGDALTPQEGGR